MTTVTVIRLMKVSKVRKLFSNKPVSTGQISQSPHQKE